MNGGPSKINRPTSHPSNPIHRQVSEKLSSSVSEKIMQSDGETQVKSGDDKKHEILKSGVIIAAAVSAFVIYRMSR